MQGEEGSSEAGWVGSGDSTAGHTALHCALLPTPLPVHYMHACMHTAHRTYCIIYFMYTQCSKLFHAAYAMIPGP